MELTTKHIHILRHSLGLDDKGHGREYRNYYCSGLDCDGYSDLIELEYFGLMKLGKIDHKNHFFYVTEEGKSEARKGVVYHKLTRDQKRYQAFRAWKDVYDDITFLDWLKKGFYKQI